MSTQKLGNPLRAAVVRARLSWGVAALLGCALAASAASPAEELLAVDRPLVIAHRGYSALAPENSLPAFSAALLSGADLVELDYHVSADGVPVVVHDATLDRTTDAAHRWQVTDVRVADRDLADLQELDAGSWFDPPYAGVGLPTLEQALDTIQSGGGVTLIEQKQGSAEQLAGLLRERDLVNEVVVQSFDWAFIAELHAALPDQVLGALGPLRHHEGRELSRAERELSPEWIDQAQAAGAQVVGWNRWITPEAVEYAHQNGLEVWIYTIDDGALAQRLLDMGVDGIITNNPALIWRTLALRTAR